MFSKNLLSLQIHSRLHHVKVQTLAVNHPVFLEAKTTELEHQNVVQLAYMDTVDQALQGSRLH